MSRPAPPRNDRFEDYVPVAERVEQFYSRFPEGRIITHVIEHDRESGFVLIRAEVYRNPDDALPAATGHAYEYKDSGYVQRTNFIEVAETSAVGRSLAFLNFETKRGIASREEIEKAQRKPQDENVETRAARTEAQPASDEQKAEILALLEALRPRSRSEQRKILMEKTGKQSREELTREEAQGFIETLKKARAS